MDAIKDMNIIKVYQIPAPLLNPIVRGKFSSNDYVVSIYINGGSRYWELRTKGKPRALVSYTIQYLYFSVFGHKAKAKRLARLAIDLDSERESKDSKYHPTQIALQISQKDLVAQEYIDNPLRRVNTIDVLGMVDEEMGKVGHPKVKYVEYVPKD